MSTTGAATGPLPETYHRAQLRRAAIASTVGTTIEWYDFLLYGQVASIVFAKLFFPKSAPLVGTLEAFGIYFVGFVARPIGAAIFGHYGDRIGRKATLIATLLLTGLSTFAVGLVPTYDQIGIWAAVVLVVLRLIQGIGVGGEWGGSVLLAMEWARTNKHRGFIAAWPQFGGPAGLFLANLAVLAFSAISGDEFITWGWRVPFYLSLVMVAPRPLTAALMKRLQTEVWLRLRYFWLASHQDSTPSFRPARPKSSKFLGMRQAVGRRPGAHRRSSIGSANRKSTTGAAANWILPGG